jgi:hypothetical protein
MSEKLEDWHGSLLSAAKNTTSLSFIQPNLEFFTVSKVEFFYKSHTVKNK